MFLCSLKVREGEKGEGRRGEERDTVRRKQRAGLQELVITELYNLRGERTSSAQYQDLQDITRSTSVSEARERERERDGGGGQYLFLKILNL